MRIALTALLLAMCVAAALLAALAIEVLAHPLGVAQSAAAVIGGLGAVALAVEMARAIWEIWR
jgi:uncharacterized membrane protein